MSIEKLVVVLVAQLWRCRIQTVIILTLARTEMKYVVRGANGGTKDGIGSTVEEQSQSVVRRHLEQRSNPMYENVLFSVSLAQKRVGSWGQ